MITQDKIQEAHDVLNAVILQREGIKISFDANGETAIHAVHDCLCWILEHECGSTFQENLERVKRAIKAQGYNLERVQ